VTRIDKLDAVSLGKVAERQMIRASFVPPGVGWAAIAGP
jgi:hypothetical protein